MQTSTDKNRKRPANETAREVAATKPGRRGACDQVWSLVSGVVFVVTGALVMFCGIHGASADEVAVAVEAADAVVFQGGAAAPIENQLRIQFEPLLKVELSFVNRVCKLTDDQRRNLIGKSNAWLNEFIVDYAKQGGQPQAIGVWMAGGRRQTNDPRESIQREVAKLVKAEVPMEQAVKYWQERQKRAEFHKQAFVESLVSRIDNELILSPDQRDKLSKSLFGHWDMRWQPQPEMFMHGMEMWPAVPDQWIRPHLSPAQQIAWGRLNKQNGNMFFGGFAHEGQVIDDIDLKEGQEKNKDAVADDKRAAAAFAAPVPAN